MLTGLFRCDERTEVYQQWIRFACGVDCGDSQTRNLGFLGVLVQDRT